MSGPGSVVASYLFHGIGLEVRCDDLIVAAALASRLAPFSTPSGGAGGIRVDVVSADSPALDRPDGRGRPVYDTPDGEVLYFDSADRLFIRAGDRAQALCRPEEGAVAMAVRPDPAGRWLASHALFTLAWIELLKRRRRFSLHAAGVAVDGGGILVAGASGSGKSTAAVALLRAGFGFLADDMVFLRPDSDGLTVLGFSDEIDVTGQTMDLFPELAALSGLPHNPVNGKRAFRAEAVYGVEPVASCRPAAVVLAGARTSGRSRLVAATPDEALVALAPNVLLTDRAASQAHLDTLGRLTRECPCFRLEAGPDPAELAELFSVLV